MVHWKINPSSHLSKPNACLYFHYAYNILLFGLTTIILAYMLDSLVRVSRRDDKERQINVLTVSFVDRLVD